MIKRNICCICNKYLKNIYCLENMPIKLSCLDKPNNTSGNLSFSQCVTCKTIQLDSLISLNELYSESHNYTSVGKVWDGYFNLFCEKINSIVVDKNILEIGDPSGKIANRINSYNKWYIIEPNKNKTINFKSNIEFIEGFFDEKFSTDKQIDMIVHSHLFEHIYEPNIFLYKCYDILKENGQMFFGIPNIEYIADKELSPFLGIFFEHTFFLNKSNIKYLLEINGFEIIEIIDYQKHSILYHVKKSNIQKQDLVIKDYYHSFFNTLNNYKIFINKCNEAILCSDKPVYLFGASYNTQFLLALGLNRNRISGIIDNCKEKEYKYLYGFDLQIFSTQIIKNQECIIILKNGYYVNEITEQILSINKNTFLLS
jgi:SAM-dependent methyltransferase